MAWDLLESFFLNSVWVLKMSFNYILKIMLKMLKFVLPKKYYLKIRNLYYRLRYFIYKIKNTQQIVKNGKDIYTSPLYKSFGIKSIEKFYKDKFLGKSVGNFLKYYSMAKYDIRYSKVTWIYNNIRPGTTILDIGCGSGHLTILYNKKIKKLVGVDISEMCLQEALRGGYDEVYKADVLSLPFDNSTFDYVVSLDLFGHIEAKLKNKVISEIARVLKPDGITLHGLEEGEIDYNKLPPDQEKEIIGDGHVGIETRDKIKKRFKRYFKKITVQGAFGPCQDWDAYIKYSKCFPADFINYIKNFSDRDIKVFNIAMGYVHNYLLEKKLIDIPCFVFLRGDTPIK